METLFEEYGLTVIEFLTCALMCGVVYKILEIVWNSLDTWGALV